MSHFECRLNRRFWRSKKVIQVVQIGGRGVIWTKSKRTAAFFRETVTGPFDLIEYTNQVLQIYPG